MAKDKLSDYVSLPLDSVPKDIGLPYPIFIQIDNRLILFRQKGDLLPEERASKLGSARVDTVYIHPGDWEAFVGDSERTVNRADLISDTRKNAQQIRSLFYAYARTMERERLFTEQLYIKVAQASAKMIRCLRTAPDVISSLLKRYSDSSLYISNHTINVAIYSLAVGLKLKLDDSQLSRLVISGLLHNIGIIRVSPTILYKKGTLEKKEWEEIQLHPEWGATILKDIGVAKEVVKAVLQSHERFDGKGYPSKIGGNEISDIAKILSIADVYDALISQRPWAQALDIKQALSLMQRFRGKFDPDFFTLADANRG